MITTVLAFSTLEKTRNIGNVTCRGSIIARRVWRPQMQVKIEFILNLSRKFLKFHWFFVGEIIVTNNEHCHTEIRQHLRKDYKLNKLNRLNSQYQDYRHLGMPALNPVIATTTTSIIRGVSTLSNSAIKKPVSQSPSPPASPVPLTTSTPTNYSLNNSGHNSNTQND